MTLSSGLGHSMDHYKVGIWKGLSNYECAYCVYSTTGEKRMMLHLAQTHSAQIAVSVPKREPAPIVYDAVGRLIKPQEPAGQVIKETEGGLENG